MNIEEIQERDLIINQIERLIILNDETRVMKEHRIIIEEKITKLLNQL